MVSITRFQFGAYVHGSGSLEAFPQMSRVLPAGVVAIIGFRSDWPGEVELRAEARSTD